MEDESLYDTKDDRWKKGVRQGRGKRRPPRRTFKEVNLESFESLTFLPFIPCVYGYHLQLVETFTFQELSGGQRHS